MNEGPGGTGHDDSWERRGLLLPIASLLIAFGLRWPGGSSVIGAWASWGTVLLLFGLLLFGLAVMPSK